MGGINIHLTLSVIVLYVVIEEFFIDDLTHTYDVDDDEHGVGCAK